MFITRWVLNAGVGLRSVGYQLATENTAAFFSQQKPMPLVYHGQTLDSYRVDLLVEGLVVVELRRLNAWTRPLRAAAAT